jgi:hypothetical protein
MTSYEIALHEAAHLVIFTKLGGQYKPGDSTKISSDYGYLSVSALRDRRYGYLLEACVLAAGIASDEIMGVSSYSGRGSDTEKLDNIYFEISDQNIIVAKVRGWLRNNWLLVQDVAVDLLKNSHKKTGFVPRRVILESIQKIKNRVHCRKLVKVFR